MPSSSKSLFAFALNLLQASAVPAGERVHERMHERVHELSQLVVAAGNRKDGSHCDAYYDCQSERCWDNVCVAKGSTGVGCGENIDCMSGMCSYLDGAIVDKCCPTNYYVYCGLYACCGDMPDGTACYYDKQCHHGYCVNNVCDAPKSPNGASCSVYDDCDSGRCWENVCVDKAPGGAGCGAHEDCTSGLCSYLDTDETTKCCPTGTWGKCGLYGCCADLPLGSTCYEHAQCQSGSCESGVCATAESDDTCGDRHMCSSSDDTSVCWDRVPGGCVERNGEGKQGYQWFEGGFRVRTGFQLNHSNARTIKRVELPPTGARFVRVLSWQCGHNNQYYFDYSGRWGGAPKIAWGDEVKFPADVVEDHLEWDYACMECLSSMFSRCLICANNSAVPTCDRTSLTASLTCWNHT